MWKREGRGEGRMKLRKVGRNEEITKKKEKEVIREEGRPA